MINIITIIVLSISINNCHISYSTDIVYFISTTLIAEKPIIEVVIPKESCRYIKQYTCWLSMNICVGHPPKRTLYLYGNYFIDS